ncbi:MAG: DUF4153 domain-containing protein [Eubacteriales bacterium]
MLLAAYALFTYVQFTYLFGGTLPVDLTYSEYARAGFGQFLVVTLVNFTVATSAKKREQKQAVNTANAAGRRRPHRPRVRRLAHAAVCRRIWPDDPPRVAAVADALLRVSRGGRTGARIPGRDFYRIGAFASAY